MNRHGPPSHDRRGPLPDRNHDQQQYCGHRHHDRPYPAAPRSGAPPPRRDHHPRRNAPPPAPIARAGPVILSIPVRTPDGTPGPPVAVQQPTELAVFSYDQSGQFHPNASSLRYWHPPAGYTVRRAAAGQAGTVGMPLPHPSHPPPAPHQIDLNAQFDQYTPSANGIEPLDNLLRGLVDGKVWPFPAGKNVHVITWRGIATKFLCAPYDNHRDGWELGAVRYNGIVFLHEHVTAARKADEEAMKADSRRARMAYWGYRFEQQCVLDTAPSSMGDTDRARAEVERRTTPVNAMAQFCSVFTTKIGPTRLVMGAEVDCCLDTPVPGNKPHYVELKTNKCVRTPGDHRAWRAKLLRIWAQSFLAGVPTVMVGFRDNDGVLVDVQELSTSDLPRMVRGAADAWDPMACLRFAAGALDRVREAVWEEGVYYVVRWAHPFDAIEVERVDGRVEERLAGQRDVLPNWFTAIRRNGAAGGDVNGGDGASGAGNGGDGAPSPPPVANHVANTGLGQ
ncbi:decapping endonuclease targeting mRNA [Allomyces arbusculus]|nr:decapping endonuclease targeting mRNA [Allomyces arbusculus]